MPRVSTRAPKPLPDGPLVFNGRQLVQNDHVFVSAPWEERDGEPYLIGRIVEILQPTTSKPTGETTPPISTTSRNGPDTSQLRLRVNYYFRTRDITNRYVADHRVVVASFHSDVVPAEYVRGVCTVRHREHIANLEVYKREPDCFYWHQLYDRYLHRYFDSVPTYKVQNAPADIVRYLSDNFEFVLCEVGTAAQLCDAQRGCCKCYKWAANPDSVTCARCQLVFHLNCLDPPLSAKPKAGYGWSCAPCSLAHDEEVENYLEAGLGPPPIRKAAETGAGRPYGIYDPKAPQMLSVKGKGKAKAVQAGARTDPREWHMLNGWPFRYFGMHASAYNVLDPHESIFPKARTRLGNKFQCVVPEWDPASGQQLAPPEQRIYFQPKRSRGSTPVGGKVEKEKPAKKGKNADVPPRGEEENLSVIWRPTSKLSDETLDELFSEVKKLKSYANAGVDLLNRAVQLIVSNEGDVPATVAALRKVTLASMGHATWTEDEKRRLAEGAEQYNNDIEEIAALIPSKKMGDVVKRYYIHIGHKRQEDEPTQPEEKVAAATRAARSSTAAASATRLRRTRAVAREEAEEEEDDDGSVCGQSTTTTGRKNRFCAVCANPDSNKWYHCPPNISELDVKPSPLVMCEECGIRWRHYGAQYPAYGDEIKPLPQPKLPSKKELEALAAEEERIAAEAAALEALKVKEPTPPPPKPVIPPKPCLLCKRFEPKTALFQCDNCTLSMHTSCFGLPEGYAPYEDWLCDLCQREEERDTLVLHPHCVLCPKPEEPEEPTPLTALDLLKPTELNNYVHALCSVWHRELLLGEPALLNPVEGFTLLPKKRLTERCTICELENIGCTVKCEDCDKHFHVGCAWSMGYKFAFEITSVRKKRPPKDVIQVKFKDEEGAMNPCVWCPDHPFTHAERKTYDLGARDQSTKLTALQMYVRANKVNKHPDAPFYLRQGRRIDAYVEPVLKPKEPTPPPAPKRRAPRPSLLTAIIEEMPGPSHSAKSSRPSAAKKRRTASLPQRGTPFEYLPEPEPEPIYQPIPEPEYYAEPQQAIEDVATASQEGTPVSGKRVRKAPKRWEPDSPKPKPAKKRRTTSHAPVDYQPYDEYEAYPVAGSSNGAAFGDLPPLPMPPNGHLPYLPDMPDLPPLPPFSASLPPLPSLPSAPMQEAGSYLDQFQPEDLPDQPFLYPSFPSLPELPLPNGENGGAESLDPTLEALSAVAAAMAEARTEAPADAPSVEDQLAAVIASQAPAAEPYPAYEQPQDYSAPEDGGPPEGDPGTQDGYSAQQEQGNGDAGTAAGSGTGASSSTLQHAEPSRADLSTSAPAAAPAEAPAETPAQPEASAPPPPPPQQETQPAPDPPSQPASGPPPPPRPLPVLAPHSQRPNPDLRYPSPSALNPILDYVRARDGSSLSRDFRIDTPDDSDGGSSQVHSPAASAGGSGVASPAPFANLPPLDMATFAAVAAAVAGPPAVAPAPTPSTPAAAEGSSRPTKRRRSAAKTTHREPPHPATCANCGTTDSPLFRRDNEGRQLCNSCGLYKKTHGVDRPKKVIDRGIGPTRVQKRKAALQDSTTPAPKRSHHDGIPLPLQQMPGFSYGDGMVPAQSPPPPVAGPSGHAPHYPFSPASSSTSGASHTPQTPQPPQTPQQHQQHAPGPPEIVEQQHYDPRGYNATTPPVAAPGYVVPPPSHQPQQQPGQPYYPTYGLPSPVATSVAPSASSPDAPRARLPSAGPVPQPPQVGYVDYAAQLPVPPPSLVQQPQPQARPALAYPHVHPAAAQDRPQPDAQDITSQQGDGPSVVYEASNERGRAPEGSQGGQGDAGKEK
ncbi:hypothetical protein JCM10207_004909 [Rhodosporidiobolus poonsookiae]